jgi:hypothetical protein
MAWSGSTPEISRGLPVLRELQVQQELRERLAQPVLRVKPDLAASRVMPERL